MYGLPQAVILSNKQLIDNLASHEYEPAKYTSGLWQHKDKKIYFALCVDDVSIKYEKRGCKLSIECIKKNYTISRD